MTTLQIQSSTTQEAQAPAITYPKGFVSTKPADKSDEHPLPLFVSMEANATSGSPLYSLQGDQRTYLPSTFVGTLHFIETRVRTYDGFKPYTKVVLRLTIGDTLYHLWLGLNSKASRCLLQSLGQLTAEELKKPLMFNFKAGKETIFSSVAYCDSVGDWCLINLPTDSVTTDYEQDELELLVGSIDELLN